MLKPKVFLNRKLSERTMTSLEESCEILLWDGVGHCPLEAARQGIAQAEAVLGHYPWSSELMDCAPRLRIIANIGVGFDNVDVAAASRRGIIVTNTPDVLTETTADLTFALLLAAARRLCEAERFVRNGEWTTNRGSEALLGADVHHATLGIIGLGRIGSAVARRATGFDMRVLYYDIVRRPDLEDRHGYEYVNLDTLLGSSDFVSLHVPLCPQTVGLVGQRELGLMKRTAYLINASRGPIVNEPALVEALREKRIAGAGLDVFTIEPAGVDNPLLMMDNVVTLPHVGSATVATRLAMETLAAANVLAHVQGRPPLTPVNPEVLGR
ncbi:MAG: D-glycerate dehydrogenase [Planctomycetaceae bacterium]|nr:MAG: D-glycerate dehydrogenase [Planctomycetaceae bacterium]